MQNIAITLNKLCCFYDEHILFNNLSLSIQPGKCIVVHGANGSGKTTLLRSLAGFHDDFSGDILFNGVVKNNPIPDLCYIGHHDGLKENLSIAENIALFQLLLDAYTPTSDEILTQFELYPLKDQLVKHCSKGQKKRSALMRLCIGHCAVWLLDEPFVSLDHLGCLLLKRLMIEHLRQCGIIIMSSHQALTLNGIKLIRIQL